MPVDQAHVRELANLIAQEAERRPGTGQQIPILLAEVPEFPELPILDGFHRVPALELLNRDTVFARIRPDTTWEEVVNQRITAATSHREVRFARLVEWVEEAWEYSPWGDRIKAWQAFQFKVSRTMTGRNLGVPPEEVEQIKEWVDRKCEQWQISPNAIEDFLKTASLADPELVREARERKGGYKLEALTPNHLKAVARTLPHRHEIQRAVAAAAKEYTLTVAQTRTLAEAVVGANTAEEVRQIAASRDWKTANIMEIASLAPSIRGVVYERQPNDEYSSELENLKDHVAALDRLGFAKSRSEAREIVVSSLGLIDEIHPRIRRKGELIYEEGEEARGIMILREGQAIVTNEDEYNNKRVAELVSGFAIIGGELLSGEDKFQSSARAFGDVKIINIPIQTLQTLIQKDPRLLPFLLVSQSIRQHERERHMREWGLKQVSHRVAGVFLDLAGRANTLPEDVHFTQELIAELAACTREAANKAISAFMRSGVVYWDQGLGPQFIDTKKLQLIRDGAYGMIHADDLD